jgi:hypothetical protein
MVKFSGDQSSNIYYANKTFSKSKSLTQYAPAYNTSINLFIDTENRNTPKNGYPAEACPIDSKVRTSRSANAKNLLFSGGQGIKKTENYQSVKNQAYTHQQDTDTQLSTPHLISSHSKRSKNPWNLKRDSVPGGRLLESS